MNYSNWNSLPEMFFNNAEKFGENPFLWEKKSSGEYQALSWKIVADTVTKLAIALKNLEVKKGDRVAIVSENRPEWAIADLAIMSIGAITVPTYITNTISDHQHILSDSNAIGVIVSNETLAKNVLAAAANINSTQFVVAIEDIVATSQSTSLHHWNNILNTIADSAKNIFQISDGILRQDTACIIYTSGTGGKPKGVMLSHEAIITNCMGAHEILQLLGLGKEVFLSFLPLSHAYEHTAGLYFPISIGAEIYYAESVDTLSTNLLEARPTIMVSVPRLYEVMHRRITLALKRQSKTKQTLFNTAITLGTKNHNFPNQLTLVQRLTNALLERLVRDKVRARFGGNLKAMISGGAPLNQEVGMFFTALGVRLLQGYGQTEAGPVISCNIPNKTKLHTVGPPLTGVEVKLANDGEILARGKLIMNGYWNDEELTQSAIQDDWLHTGDIGEIDEDGYIQITDRKKDIIILSGGDNLSPQKIESILTLQPQIDQAMIYGEGKPHAVALIVPEKDFTDNWVSENSSEETLLNLSKDNHFIQALAPAVERTNKQLSAIERIKGFLVAKEPFTIDNELLTPTLKLRRHKILQIYKNSLEKLY